MMMLYPVIRPEGQALQPKAFVDMKLNCQQTKASRDRLLANVSWNLLAYSLVSGTKKRTVPARV